jgi:hypothetical protein
MEKFFSAERIAKIKAANRGPGADRPKHEIVAEAKVGQPGKLTVPFVSKDPEQRLEEIERVLDSHTLDGLVMELLLNPEDAVAQPLPALRSDLIVVADRRDVPAGEFHIELTPASANATSRPQSL